jgi:hypothetical protein
MEGIVLAFLVYGVVFGAFSAYVAGTKNRDEAAWFVLGMVFGIVALLAIGLAAPASSPARPRTGSVLRCRACKALLQAGDATCWSCGADATDPIAL